MNFRFLSLTVLTSLILGACASANKSATTPDTTAAKSAASDVKSATEKTATAVKDAAHKAVAAAKVECANKADQRVLEVRPKDKGCEAVYTKEGKEAVVATSRAGSAHCQTVVERITEKLKASGYTCK